MYANDNNLPANNGNNNRRTQNMHIQPYSGELFGRESERAKDRTTVSSTSKTCDITMIFLFPSILLSFIPSTLNVFGFLSSPLGKIVVFLCHFVKFFLFAATLRPSRSSYFCCHSHRYLKLLLLLQQQQQQQLTRPYSHPFRCGFMNRNFYFYITLFSTSRLYFVFFFLFLVLFLFLFFCTLPLMMLANAQTVLTIRFI